MISEKEKNRYLQINSLGWHHPRMMNKHLRLILTDMHNYILATHIQYLTIFARNLTCLWIVPHFATRDTCHSDHWTRPQKDFEKPSMLSDNHIFQSKCLAATNDCRIVLLDAGRTQHQYNMSTRERILTKLQCILRGTVTTSRARVLVFISATSDQGRTCGKNERPI